MDFKNIEISDRSRLLKYLCSEKEQSCGNTFVNLLVWQKLYGAGFAEEDGVLYIRYLLPETEMYTLPLGDTLKGVKRLIAEKGEMPFFYAADGEAFRAFLAEYGESYEINESRNEFDYIYLRENLEFLRGKKFHSKRNHIAAFSKQYDWSYKAVTYENIPQVRECAEKWYSAHSAVSDAEMATEREGLKTMLANFDALGLSGGMINIGEETVAFTLASAVNGNTYDIHIEKALPEYDTAYTVINREFVSSLPENVKYINREDDLGLEGLRRAKLSYHPDIMLKKYLCIPKEGKL